VSIDILYSKYFINLITEDPSLRIRDAIFDWSLISEENIQYLTSMIQNPQIRYSDLSEFLIHGISSGCNFILETPFESQYFNFEKFIIAVLRRGLKIEPFFEFK